MPLPADIHDADKQYRIRICMTPEQLGSGPFGGSIIRVCDGCGQDLWYHAEQVIPEADVPIDGDLIICTECYIKLDGASTTPAVWL